MAAALSSSSPVTVLTPVADWPGWAPVLAVAVLVAAAVVLAVRLSTRRRLPLAA